MTSKLNEHSKKSGRIAGIDSLRFFAFLMVFLFHSSSIFFFGFLGVDFFFVLSSFLLTYLALKEIRQTDTFSRKNFFIRRVLRIFPLYYLIVFIGLVLLPLLTNYLNIDISLPKRPLFFWFFLSNYDNSPYLLALKFLWSIAVEEQFYILFLALSLFFRNYLWYVIATLLVLYFGYFLIDQHYNWAHYKNVFFHFANFGFGMAGGYLYFLDKISKKKTVLSIFLSTFLLFLSPYDSVFFQVILSIWFVSVIFGTIAISKMIENFKVFQITEYLGKYTYGLYLYSGFIITFGNKFAVFKNKFLNGCMEFLILLLISYLSYHLYEKKFLKLKKAFRKKPKE